MGHREHYISVKPFFAHAVAATLSVILVPVAVVGALIAALDPNPPILLASLVGVALAIAIMVMGTALWSRRPEAFDIGFSELMLWRWARRRHAEEELAHGARLLGLDRSGQPIDDVRISPEQQLQVLKDLTAALESKDPYTHGHSQRVERHSYRTAAAMGLSAEDIEDLRKAAALHDVGKIRVPDRILRKAGELSPEERAIVEEHAVVGAWMVSSVGNADVVAAVRHHHERWDGTGYPDGLAGADIPLFARVIAVADAYDAITSTRPYRASSGRDDAVTALRANAGTQFDPAVVERFIESLPSRVPVAAGLFVLMGGPGRLLREIAMWFRRLGAGSLTPAAGAAGAAIVLGASIFTPNVVDAGPSFQKNTSAVDVNDDGAPLVVDDNDDRVLNERVRNKKDNERDKTRKARRNDAPTAADKGDDEPAAAAQPASSDKEPKEEAPEPAPAPEPDQTNPNDTRDTCSDDGNAGHGNDDREC